MWGSQVPFTLPPCGKVVNHPFRLSEKDRVKVRCVWFKRRGLNSMGEDCYRVCYKLNIISLLTSLAVTFYLTRYILALSMTVLRHISSSMFKAVDCRSWSHVWTL